MGGFPVKLNLVIVSASCSKRQRRRLHSCKSGAWLCYYRKIRFFYFSVVNKICSTQPERPFLIRNKMIYYLSSEIRYVFYKFSKHLHYNSASTLHVERSEAIHVSILNHGIIWWDRPSAAQPYAVQMPVEINHRPFFFAVYLSDYIHAFKVSYLFFVIPVYLGRNISVSQPFKGILHYLLFFKIWTWYPYEAGKQVVELFFFYFIHLIHPFFLL